MKNISFVKNALYHLYNRSLSPLSLFIDRSDYAWFLQKFKYYMRQVPSTVIAYALMPNHFHFLIRQDSDIPLSKLFNMVLSVYVRHFNYIHDRKGVLLEGRTKYKPVLKDEYFVFLCMYIHSNPIEAGIVDKLEDWEYSNYLEWVGKREGELFSREIIDEYFPNKGLYKEQLKELSRIKKQKKFVEKIDRR